MESKREKNVRGGVSKKPQMDELCSKRNRTLNLLRGVTLVEASDQSNDHKERNR